MVVLTAKMDITEKRTLDEKGIKEAMDILARTYPDARCALDHASPFQLLVAVVLSAQTTDKKVNQVTDGLFGLYPEAPDMAGADRAVVEECIHSIGMYRQKAANIIALSQILVDKYDGQVPDDQEKLMELPGVGRKTANVVMAEVFGHQRIAVDTHVFRVSNRIGLASGKDVLETERSLMKNIPENMWTISHHRLIWHGRLVCDSRKPKCDICTLSGLCCRNGIQTQ